MVASKELMSLKAFLDEQPMTPEERGQTEDLIAHAQIGDTAALSRIRQAAQERGYAPITDKGIPLEPGPLMVCPVGPSHYRTYRREVGQELVCPEHEKPLIILKGK